MPKVNKTKLQTYANKLYRGDLQRYKKKKEKENDMFSITLFYKEDDKIKYIIENRCFLREALKLRKKLKPGKAFCRINKGYFEKAFEELLGDKIKKIEINFLEDDEENDVCIEELTFSLK